MISLNVDEKCAASLNMYMGNKLQQVLNLLTCTKVMGMGCYITTHIYIEVDQIH